VISALRLTSIVAAVAVGGLTTTVAALVLWAMFTMIGVGDPPGAALVAGLGLGLGAAGYVAGRTARAFWRFHGMVAGLAVAALVVVVSRLGGSPAPTPQVLLLAAIGIIIGGVGGVIGGRRARLRSRVSKLEVP
jgi:putative membrane protein (TIGR04086 family)